MCIFFFFFLHIAHASSFSAARYYQTTLIDDIKIEMKGFDLLRKQPALLASTHHYSLLICNIARVHAFFNEFDYYTILKLTRTYFIMKHLRLLYTQHP